MVQSSKRRLNGTPVGFRHPTPSCDSNLEKMVDRAHVYVNIVSVRRIVFYKTGSGKCPVQEHLDTLSDKQVTKIAWVLKLVRETDPVPTNYFKKLVNTNDIWELRVDVGRDTFRLLGFLNGRDLVILTNSFQKKTQKTPSQEIKLAERRKTEFLNRS